MKTEAQTTKKNIKNLKWTQKEQDSKGYIWVGGKKIDKDSAYWICYKHKTTCQRTMQKWINLFNLLKEKGELKTWVNAYINNEIDDNQNAIKLYEDNGI